MKKNKKQEVVKELNEKFLKSNLVIVSEYKGLDVQMMTALRKKVREVDAEIRVVKNTLLRIASEETDVKSILEYFKGPNAIMMSKDDPVAAAKALVNFAKEFEKLKIKAGVLDGKVLAVQDIKKLSSMPSKEVLLSQLLSVFNAVPTSFVRVISGVQLNLLNVLNAIKDKKEQ